VDWSHLAYELLIRGKIEVAGRRGRRRKQLLDDLKEKRGYCTLEENRDLS
jgi:hypothetical protein